MAKKERIDRNGYIAVVDKSKLATAEFDDYVYEHRLVAEEMLGRPLKEGEEVHHLDSNRTNNSPDNLLILSGPMHAKLHAWMDKNVIIPKPEYQERKELGCIRCLCCEKPIDPKLLYCSTECNGFSRRKVERPDKETLQQLLWEKPTIQIAQDFGVSDKAVEKWSKVYEIEKPPRGYWNKVAANALKDL